MSNLQDLFDFYLSTNPSTGKVRNATNFLIHACKAMNVDSPQQIGQENFNELPAAIDRYFNDNVQKAIHDKGVLAEMIGRYGPRDGWETVLNILLNEPDENLRQFALQSLEFAAYRNPGLIMPYIEQYRQSDQPLMRQVSAVLVTRMLCSGKCESIKENIEKWYDAGDHDFVQRIKRELNRLFQNSIDEPTYKKSCLKILDWLQQRFVVSDE